MWFKMSSIIFFVPQEELEHLNEASAEINKLELQLDVSINGHSTVQGERFHNN